jgi:hypothetical protein
MRVQRRMSPSGAHGFVFHCDRGRLHTSGASADASTMRHDRPHRRHRRHRSCYCPASAVATKKFLPSVMLRPVISISTRYLHDGWPNSVGRAVRRCSTFHPPSKGCSVRTSYRSAILLLLLLLVVVVFPVVALVFFADNDARTNEASSENCTIPPLVTMLRQRTLPQRLPGVVERVDPAASDGM